MPYQSTKTFNHEVGLSCCFRQWRAQSHCRLLHGYALAFKFVFEADKLDETNWVVDFGSLKPLKGILEDNFDHTLLVAEDDPMKEHLLGLDKLGLAKVVEVPSAGCEATAKMVYEVTEQWLKDAGYGERVRLVSVEVREHGANSALYVRPQLVQIINNVGDITIGGDPVEEGQRTINQVRQNAQSILNNPQQGNFNA